MKKLIAPLALAALLVLTGCSAEDTSPTSPTSPKDSEAAAEEPQAPDLVGEWQQSNAASEDAYQQATITADVITIEWVSDGGDTRAIYRVGTFEAPTDVSGAYTWTSVRDAAATDSALLPSTADSKDFTFEGDTISYEVSAVGTTTVVDLKKN